MSDNGHKNGRHIEDDPVVRPSDLFAPPAPKAKGTSGIGRPVSLPAPPPGTATATHAGTGLPVHLDRTHPGSIDNPTVMAALEGVLRAIGSQVPIRSGRFNQRALGIYMANPRC